MEGGTESAWAPGDDAELAAGWRLWLELCTRTWPDPSWDGTPADAARQLRDLVAVCEDIEVELLAGRSATSAKVLRLLRSLTFTASFPIELWRDDEAALDAERAALLHADLAGFADHAAGVRTVLAHGGGWAELDEVQPRWGYPTD